MLREGSAMEVLASGLSPAEGLQSPPWHLQPQRTAKKPSWNRSWHVVPLPAQHRVTLGSCLPKGEAEIRKQIRLNAKCLPVDIADSTGISFPASNGAKGAVGGRHWGGLGEREQGLEQQNKAKCCLCSTTAAITPAGASLHPPLLTHSTKFTFNTSSELLMAYKVIC